MSGFCRRNAHSGGIFCFFAFDHPVFAAGMPFYRRKILPTFRADQTGGMKPPDGIPPV
jgi:hypothetical protein